MIEDNELTVEFAGEYSARLRPSEQLAFGRASDLVIDADNKYLHRRLGRLFHQGDRWFLKNTGSSIVIEIDSANGARATVPPGHSAALPPDQSFVRFRAGRFQYEIECVVASGGSASLVSQMDGGSVTTAPQTINLTLGRRVLLAALAEPELTAQTQSRPTSADLALRLNTTPKAVERKLDAICEALDPSRILGLAGSPETAASRRRELLVRYVIETKMIGRADLELLQKLDAEQAK